MLTHTSPAGIVLPHAGEQTVSGIGSPVCVAVADGAKLSESPRQARTEMVRRILKNDPLSVGGGYPRRGRFRTTGATAGTRGGSATLRSSRVISSSVLKYTPSSWSASERETS